MEEITLNLTKPERLDKTVAHLLNTSRSKVQRAIKNGAVLVNGEQKTPHFAITQEDTVTYDPEAFAPKQKLDGPIPPLDILFENDDVLVINKQAGVIVHDTETNVDPTLVDALIAHDAAIADVGDKKERAGLVHRLDKHASGVMIVAKTPAAFDHLKQQFKDRLTTKKYTVLIKGHPAEPHGTIDLNIERSKSTGRMAAKPTSQSGKPAITHYDTIKSYPHHTLLDVHIETGRTHQIRAHMFAMGHPVVGDTLYRQRGIKPMDIGRLFLHARELTITLPSGEEKTFTAPLPSALEQVLEDIPKL
jgi:23S rRNA pseudouridine1911/1915/1917 synthase